MQKSLLKSKFLPPPSPTSLTSSGRRGSGGPFGKRDYTPVSWRAYWDKCQDIEVNSSKFRVYYKGSSGPLLLLLHGGGYSALTWSLFASCISDMVECQVMAFDQRGHGDTTTSDDDDLSAKTLASDVSNLMEKFFGDTSIPPCVIIGHSMGGAVAVNVAYENLVTGLVGLVVIDVVEGTALDALSSMQSFLRGRPQQFISLDNAVEWSVRSGQTRNVDAARISMPGQVKRVDSGACGTVDVEKAQESSALGEGSLPFVRGDVILEETEGDSGDNSSCVVQKPPVIKYTWRINLSKTEHYWPGWFQGLSSKFLSSYPSKMLLLAGIDRLDTDLTVGQMQGKFQMQVLPQCGHAVHEDVPDRVAEVLATFLLRHKLTQSKGSFNMSFPAC